MTDDWNQMLEPPPGGLSRLIDAVRANRAPRSNRFSLALAAATLVIIGIAIHLHRSPDRKMRDELTSALSARGQVYVENGAALELPTSRPDVRLFVIAQMPAADSAN